MSILPDSLTYMQRVQDAARLGYPWYVTGELSLEKWPSLEIKLAELYVADAGGPFSYSLAPAIVRGKPVEQTLCALA